MKNQESHNHAHNKDHEKNNKYIFYDKFEEEEFEMRLSTHSGLTLNQLYKLDKRPNALKVETSKLKSIFLNENPTFINLLSQINKWNIEVDESDLKAKKIVNGAYKNNLFKQLGGSLEEVINTQERHTQLKFLYQIEKWYQDQLPNCKDVNFVHPQLHAHKDSNQLQTHTHFDNHNNSTQNANTRMNNSQIYDNQTNMNNDEDLKYRTKYTDIDPPEDRVKNFYRKFPKNQTPQTRPQTSGMETHFLSTNMSRPDTRGSDFNLRPQSNFSGFRGLTSAHSQMRPDIGFNSELKNSSLMMNQQNQQLYPQFQQGLGSPIQFTNFSLNKIQTEQRQKPVSMIPELKNYVNDAQTANAYEYDDKWHQKTELRSTFMSYQPTNDIQELKLEEQWLSKRNKGLQEKRENEELIQYITNWGFNKGIVEQEINKKNEIMQQASQFDCLGKQKQRTQDGREINEKHFQIQQKTEEQRKNELLKPFQQKEEQIQQNLLLKKRLQLQQQQKINQQKLDQINNEQQFNSQVTHDYNQSSTINLDENVNAIQEENINDQEKQESVELAKQKKLEATFKNFQFQPQEGYIIQKNNEQQPDYFQQFQDYEKKIKLLRIKQIRENRGAIINAKFSKTESLKDLTEWQMQERLKNSVSAFSSKRIKLKEKNQYRPFTSIYRKISQEGIQASELEEIQKVKQSYTKQGLRCSMQTLQSAFLTPSGFSQSQMKNLKLPDQTSGLLENPFILQKKKAVKKGKKKKL